MNCNCDTVSHQDGKYGDNETLQIMNRFRRFYEGKLKEIEKEGGGDCLELKVKVQQKWIEDLTEQTEMMAKIVKELEVEATERVQILEDKLKQSSKAAYEVMKRYQSFNCTHNLEEPFQKAFYMENDVKNLVEFVRRIREDGRWSVDGLTFYDVSYGDLFGKQKEAENEKNVSANVESYEMDANKDVQNENEETNRLTQEIQFVNHQLKAKEEECESLRKSMFDMRSALTEEVACKHDMISSLKKDIQQLEERCVQSDKQTAFKDDIIKELRKEIKMLKQQPNGDFEKQKEVLLKKITDLEVQLKAANKKLNMYEQSRKTCDVVNNNNNNNINNNSNAKLIQNKDEIIQIQSDTLNVIQNELQECRKRDNELNSRNDEINRLKCICRDLETELEDTKGRADNLQKAVDLYLNSINVLEATEAKSRMEVEQQKMTINNLQEALVSAKHELDEIREKNQQEVSVGWAARWFGGGGAPSAPPAAPKEPNNQSVHEV